MKIVFLDIDGVLNHRGTPTIDSTCLAEVQRIAKETGAKFVLPSSWKEVLMNPREANGFDLQIIHTLMYDCGLEFVGYTPLDPEDRREVEIQQWLDEHSEEIDQFVILDDLPYNLQEEFPNNFVKTAGYFGKGLTAKHADDAIRILMSPKA